jgi:regulator of replication initiation timing
MPNEISTPEMPSGSPQTNPQSDMNQEINSNDYEPTDSEIKGINVEAEEVLAEAKNLNLEDSELRSLIELSDLMSTSFSKKLEKRVGQIDQLNGVIGGSVVA